jgi:Ca2+-binding EF-hand superfamily protein
LALQAVFITAISDVLFTEFDQDKSGSISFNEYVSGYARISKKYEIASPKLDALQKAFALIDTDKSNSVSKAEYYNYIKNHFADLPDLVKFASTAAFTLWDHDKSGYLTKKEFHDGILEAAKHYNITPAPTEDSINLLFSAADKAKDGKVFINDFINAVHVALSA